MTASTVVRMCRTSTPGPPGTSAGLPDGESATAWLPLTYTVPSRVMAAEQNGGGAGSGPMSLAQSSDTITLLPSVALLTATSPTCGRSGVYLVVGGPSCARGDCVRQASG